MSAFDLAGDHDSASLIDQARANPLDLSQPAGFFTGMGTGLVTGLGRLAADTQRTTGLALGAVAGSFDLLTGDAIKAQDKVFEHIVTPADKLSRHLAPKAEEIGMAGQILHGLVKIGGEAVAFGPGGVLVNETVGGTLDALDKGVDLQTAAKVGGVQGAAMTAGVIAPMTLGASGLGMNVLYGAGINLAQGVFQRGATSEIYAKAGRADLAMQYKALDGEAMAVDAILGAAFAGGGRALQIRGEKAKSDAVAEYKAKISEMLAPEHIDAALVKNEQLKMERSGFGLPADLASRDAHVANLTGAIDDLMEGRPVTMREPVGDTIPDPAAAKVQADVEEEIMILWHGSPHKFDKFRLDAIGTGEGAQAYGHGLYFAESQQVAAEYQRKLAGADNGMAGQIAASKLQMYKTPEAAIAALKEGITPNLSAEAKAMSQSAIDLLEQGKADTGNLYKAGIPAEAVARFLDWDKPLSQQPEALEAMKRAGYAPSPEMTAGDFVKSKSSEGFGAYLSDDLAKQGIPGIRYLDGGSRGAGEGTSNFVVFDPDLIRILERNSEPLAPKVGAGDTAANDPALDPWNEPQAPRTFEQRIGDESIRAELLRMKGETGWAEVGGRMIRQQDDGGNETITRTAWVPNAEWWPGRPKGLKETDLHKAIDKALNGEPLKPAERRAVEYMADVAEQRQRSEAWKPTGDELAETGLASHNELDVAMTARAAEIDPDAVESLATRFESDDAGFMRGIKELLDEHDRQTAESRQGGERAPQPAGTDTATGTATALRPDTVIPLDDADATTTVAEAQGIITDLETARAEQETGLRAAVACFLRAA